MKKKNLKIFIVATEQSGDNLGSSLMNQLKSNYKKNISFYGIGGENMIKEGLNVSNHLSEFKSLGFFELIINLKKIFKILNQNVKKAILLKPDLIITIDSPDFSFRFVKKVKKNKLKTKYVHYVAPTVWAWRPWRAKYVSNLYDLLLTIFPFENKYFEKYNLKTVFIGHPIFDLKSNKIFCKNKDYLALLPGSRIGEVNSLLPYFQAISDYIYTNNIKLKLFIPTLPHLEKIIYKNIKNWKIKPKIISDKKNINKFFSKTKIAIVCSGTAALEVSNYYIPLIVVYKLNFFTEMLFKTLVTIKYANIINIIANKEIIPEIINHNLTNKNLINAFIEIYKNKTIQKNQIIKVKNILNKLSLKKNSSLSASKEIIKII